MTFDSNEEKFFYDWLIEMKDNNLVKSIIDSKKTFSICDEVVFTTEINTIIKGKKKIKILNKKLLRDKKYTPDFIIELENNVGIDMRLKAQNKPLTEFIISSDGLCYIDVKGEFTRNLTSSITFADRQAMMYNRHGIYINKVIPYGKKACLFKNTFYPKSFIIDQIYKIGIKKGLSKIIGNVTTVKEFIELNDTLKKSI
jgi:hypothetical protein